MIRCDQVKFFIEMLKSSGIKRDIGTTEESLAKLDELYSITKVLHPVDSYRNGEDRSLWLFEQNWLLGCSWFHLYLAEHEGNRGVWLNDFFIIDTRDNGSDRLDASLLLDWLIWQVKKCIYMIEEGTYFPFLQEHLPFEQRTGYILQKDYWKYVPSDMERSYGIIDSEKKELFIKSVKEGKRTEPYKTISASDYYRDCVKILELFGKEIITELSIKDNFFYYYYGRRLDWLRNMDENDSEAFEDWIVNGPVDHQFDFCYTHYVIRIQKDERGFYYKIYTNRESELIPCILEAAELGMPINFSEYDSVAKELSGDCVVKIVPRDAGSSEIENIDINDEKMIAYSRCLPENANKELIDSITWSDLSNKYFLDKDMVSIPLYKRWNISISKENWEFLCKYQFHTDDPSTQMIQQELEQGIGIREEDWYIYYTKASWMLSNYIEQLKIAKNFNEKE